MIYFLQNIYTFLTNRILNLKKNNFYYEIINNNCDDTCDDNIDDDYCGCGLCNFIRIYILPIFRFFTYKIKYD
jgi:hypothetical protein